MPEKRTTRGRTYDERRSLEAFWSKVRKTDTCWLWTASNNGAGYGCARFMGERYLAHRLSYILENGSIPEGLDILHRCDIPACVRPDHLWAGTARDNGRDMAQKGRVNPASIAALRANWSKDALVRGDAHWARRHPDRIARGVRSGGAKLTDAQVLEIRSRYADGESQDKLALAYGIRQSSIWAIVRRKSWTHI